MYSTVILVLGAGLTTACIVGLIGVRKWKGRLGIIRGRGLLSFKRHAGGGEHGEPSTSFEFVVVGKRNYNPDEHLRQELIETLEVGEPVMLIEETAEDGHADFRVVVSEGTIGYVPRNKVPKLQAIAAAGASMRCEISYIVRQTEGVGIWASVEVLPES